jgi:hypothetical protein
MDLHKIEEELDYHENIRCMDERILRAELDAIERDRRGAKNDKIALAVALGISLVGMALATWLAVGAWPL